MRNSTFFTYLMQDFKGFKGFKTAISRQIDKFGDYESLMRNEFLSKLCVLKAIQQLFRIPNYE